jgi:acetyltransferase-like isoleucine patch superfamily enzyme
MYIPKARIQNDRVSYQGLTIEASEGCNVTIEENTQFERSRISLIGTNCQVDLGKSLIYKNLFIRLVGNNKRVIVRESSKMIANLKIVSHRGDNQKVLIGSNLSCGGLELQMNDGDEEFVMGDDCLLSWGIKARTSDGHSVIDLKTLTAINLPSPIIIGNHVWICEDVKLMKGTKIPNNSIVAAGAIVTKSFEDIYANSIIGGVPAQIIRTGVTWDRRMPSDFNSR